MRTGSNKIVQIQNLRQYTGWEASTGRKLCHQAICNNATTAALLQIAWLQSQRSCYSRKRFVAGVVVQLSQPINVSPCRSVNLSTLNFGRLAVNTHILCTYRQLPFLNQWMGENCYEQIFRKQSPRKMCGLAGIRIRKFAYPPGHAAESAKEPG